MIATPHIGGLTPQAIEHQSAENRSRGRGDHCLWLRRGQRRSLDAPTLSTERVHAVPGDKRWTRRPRPDQILPARKNLGLGLMPMPGLPAELTFPAMGLSFL